ncbi:CYTH domain-containing protein [Butyrivibrio sp. AE2032]|uniref:CYTH domain-containing protein n=1 Tax=Butyrivibrio sp. AE2032 TaxID=1458463 RepID=UPI00054D0E67|nr:CYTH domain-containing protein [Butyrivibrio sp. AE2032]
MGVEIERKFTVKELPKDLESYPYRTIEQAYLNVRPAIRVRKDNESYYMTYKCQGAQKNTADIGQTEYNLPLDETTYEHLKAKADGNVITKKRYLIPLNSDGFEVAFLVQNPDLSKAIESGDIKIELDIFEGVFEGRLLAEVEFPSEEAARAYKPAEWFDEDVTGDPRYSNAHMSQDSET